MIIKLSKSDPKRIKNPFVANPLRSVTWQCNSHVCVVSWASGQRSFRKKIFLKSKKGSNYVEAPSKRR